MEFLENRRSREIKTPPENRQKSGLFETPHTVDLAHAAVGSEGTLDRRNFGIAAGTRAQWQGAFRTLPSCERKSLGFSVPESIDPNLKPRNTKYILAEFNFVKNYNNCKRPDLPQSPQTPENPKSEF